MEPKGFFHEMRFNPETGEGQGEFARTGGEGGLQRFECGAAIDGTEGLVAPIGTAGQDHLSRGPVGALHQPGQKASGQLRQVARHDEVPFSGGVAQGGDDAGEGTGARVEVRYRGQNGMAYKDGVTGGTGDGARHFDGEFSAAAREERFVPAHTGAAATRQHVPRTDHKKMITLGLQGTADGRVRARQDHMPDQPSQRQWSATHRPPACASHRPCACPQGIQGMHVRRIGDRIRGNILRHFCFILAIVGLTAASGYGAGPGAPQRLTSVVRPDVRTGKLVRSVVVSPKPVSQVQVGSTVVAPRAMDAAAPAPAPAPPVNIDEAVQRIAAEHALPPQLIHSVIKVESNYNTRAVSNKGAQGLMQLIPATARRFGVNDAFNPVENIQGGAKYLRYLLDLYGGNYPLALAAYNAGEGAVSRHRGIPPYAETQNYVIQVKRQLEQAMKPAAANASAAPTVPPTVEARNAAPAHIVEIVEADGSVRYVSR